KPGWPDDPETVSEAKAHPEVFAGKKVGQVADHVDAVIHRLNKKPVVMGHSFGGLLTQIVAGRGHSAASVAIDPAPFRGVLPLPISSLKSASPVLQNPANWNRAIPLTYEQFRYAFANAVSEAEARELYDTFAVPAPGAPRLQAAALRRRDDLLGRVHEDVELAAQEPQQEVADAEAGAHPPRARRVAQDEQLPRAIRGRARQPRHIGVAADDAVHDHDVRALDLARRLGEVRHLALDAVGQPSVAQQARGDVLIRWRQLDAHGASRTGFQEFDLDGSDAAADLEHGSAFDALRLQKVHDPARSSIKAPAAVAARLGTCAAL